MIYMMLLIVHIFTLFKKGHMEDPGGQRPGVCCICGKTLTFGEDD